MPSTYLMDDSPLPSSCVPAFIEISQVLLLEFTEMVGAPQQPVSLLLDALDDDQYVEYQLEDLIGFPSSAEEEERMLMEAVMDFLKDLEVQNPKAEKPPAISSVTYVSVELSDKDNSHDSSQEISKPMEKESSLVEHRIDSKPKNISIALEESASLNAEPNTVVVKHPLCLKSEPSLIGGVQLPPPQDNTLSASRHTKKPISLQHSIAKPTRSIKEIKCQNKTFKQGMLFLNIKLQVPICR
ncbi:hypothetical protein KIW84_014130 [Lathyrus oleraceus]|uniref:Uncharacterized protein n=1 Tax=Pisum sativum TaxID=3888 RepID=A0A9D5BLW2_PEA|nr:hypothetical protein KIW84_014130 [Pisum sativum]